MEIKNFLIICLLLIGCNQTTQSPDVDPKVYTAQHKGVTCKMISSGLWENCSGGYYKDGKKVPLICDFVYQCSDGKKTKQRW